MKLILVLFTVLMFTLVACQPGQPAIESASPTAAPVQEEIAEIEEEAQPTEAPATDTPQPDTPTAMATAEPTAMATEALPTPTDEALPEMSVESLTGLWTQSEGAGEGNNWLLFNADGSYEAKHGPSFETGVPVLKGTYRVENGVITLLDVEECPEGGEQYDVAFITPERIRFDLKMLCASPGLLPETPVWTRFEAAS